MLYIFSGLPAVGKTTLAKYLASHVGGAYLRVDTIEQTLKNAGIATLYDEGYRVAASIAEENLTNGVPVIADSTNPVNESRLLWYKVADSTAASFINIEVICSDINEHKYRVEHRQSDIAQLTLPTWESVTTREFEPWTTKRIVIDTAGKTVQQSSAELLNALSHDKLIQGG